MASICQKLTLAVGVALITLGFWEVTPASASVLYTFQQNNSDVGSVILDTVDQTSPNYRVSGTYRNFNIFDFTSSFGTFWGGLDSGTFYWNFFFENSNTFQMSETKTFFYYRYFPWYEEKEFGELIRRWNWYAPAPRRGSGTWSVKTLGDENPSPIPEPTSVLGLLAIGVLGTSSLRRKNYPNPVKESYTIAGKNS